MKGEAAAKLSTSNDQVDYRRGQQDFKESMDYAQQDYDRSVKRSETAFKLSLTRMDADFKTQMGRAEKHFKTSMTRMGEDFKVSTNRAYEDLSRFGQEVSGTSTEIQQKYLNAVADLPSAAKKTMSKNVKDMVSEMKTSFSSTFDQNFKQFGISASDLSAANPATVNMNLSPANSMTLPTDDTITLNSDYKIVDKGSSKKSGNYVIVNLGAYDYVYTGLDASSVTKLAKGATGKAGTSIGTTVKYTNVYTPQMLSGAHGTSFALADGGIVTRQINAVVGEAGYPEAVIPLNDRGANMLADAMARYVNGTDAQMSRVTPYSTSIDNSSTSHVYDNKTVFSGPVSVVAQDPNEMARKLTVRTRRDRMVQTVGNR